MGDQEKLCASVPLGSRLRSAWLARIASPACAAVTWEAQKHFDYIMGNPPFVGFTYMSAEQKADMLALFPKNKNLDFVCGWYKKAWEHVSHRDAEAQSRGENDLRVSVPPWEAKTKCAFVSTNSITQGEQVAILWKNLPGLKIDFAYRTFKWHNEAKDNAAVHCVIIGFSDAESHTKVTKDTKDSSCPSCSSCEKTIFDESGTPYSAANINGYLMDAPDVLIESRNKPLCDVPQMVYGNKPVDGGNLLLSPEERDALLAAEPQTEPLIRTFLGADEFINRKERYCLWLVDASPVLIAKCQMVKERIAQTKAMRLASVDKGAQKLAATPSLFRDTRNPPSAIVVPCHSSEKRDYIPMAFIDGSSIVGNANLFIPDATLYHFGVLTSRMHNAWMRAVCGRLKSDYRYSKDIVYNNFIWPTTEEEEKISAAAQAILDIREQYLAADESCTLAILYNPETMPPDLVKAHAALDSLVDKAYGRSFASDADRVAHLFTLYSNQTTKGA